MSAQAWHKWWFATALCSNQRVQLFRGIFCGLLCFDVVHRIPQASRYGADGFNLAHFSLLDAIAPSPTQGVVLAVYIVAAYLAGRAALWPPPRWLLPSTAVLLGAVYLWSQLDSYQHHYFLLLLLIAMSFMPWQSAPGRARSQWPIRLLLVQASALYLWAAIAKLDPLWLDGFTLQQALGASPLLYSLVAQSVGFAAAALLVLAAELFLVVAIHLRCLAWPAVMVGAALHLGMELANLGIDNFSYYMLALYVLVAPARPWEARVGEFLRRMAAKITVSLPPALVAFAALASVMGIYCLPFASAGAAAVLIVSILVVPMAWGLRGRALRRESLSHLLACLIVAGLIWTSSSIVVDYYRFAGATARRLGKREQALAAYSKAVEFAPHYASGYAKIGDLLAQTNARAARLQYQRAAQLDPSLLRAQLGLAALYHREGRGQKARESAQRALQIAPRNSRARYIYNYWAKSGPHHETPRKSRPHSPNTRGALPPNTGSPRP